MTWTPDAVLDILARTGPRLPRLSPAADHGTWLLTVTARRRTLRQTGAAGRRTHSPPSGARPLQKLS